MSPNEVLLDLPNNLVGTVSIASISPQLRERLDATSEDQESEDDGSPENKQDIELKRMFYQGQYLRACVISTTDEVAHGDRKTRKHLDLTLDPSKTNPGLSQSNLARNCMVQASIASVEDHGFVMDLGMHQGSAKGFMSDADVPSQLENMPIQPGMTFLCLVKSIGSNGKVIKLSSDHQQAGDTKSSGVLSEAPTIDSLLPGTAIEMLVTQNSQGSLAGKVMGTTNTYADHVHSGAGPFGADLESRYPLGSKVKARIIFSLRDSRQTGLGVSLLDNVLCLRGETGNEEKTKGDSSQTLAPSSFVEQAKVCQVEPGLGVYLKVDVDKDPGFAHISRLSDERVASISRESGKYKVNSVHRARVLGYNSVDGLHLLSLQKSILEKPFLHVQDVPIGEVVRCRVQRLIIGPLGVNGIVLDLDGNLTGFVPELHIADIHLQHPERKFKEGMSVKARVISVNPLRRQIRLTLKKSLVDQEGAIWKKYDDISIGSSSTGVVSKTTPHGAVLRFWGNIRGFLPAAEMSSIFVENPASHLKLGQTVKVRALDIKSNERRLILSCKSLSSYDPQDEAVFAAMRLGQLVAGTVTEKTSEELTIDLKDSNLRATLPLSHCGDGSLQRASTSIKKIRVGQSLTDLLVIGISKRKRSLVVSNKSSLVKVTKEENLVTQVKDLPEGSEVTGFVRNIIDHGVIVQLAGGIQGLLHKSQISEEKASVPQFDMSKGQSLQCRVLKVDKNPLNPRFNLTMKELRPVESTQPEDKNQSFKDIINPIDSALHSYEELIPGRTTKCRITSVKDTQLNVQLAENVQGRIDVSEAFQNWTDIKDRKRPLKTFHPKQNLDVKVLGVHDARNHRFLPISHRSGKVSVFELSAKVQKESKELSDDGVSIGSEHVAFVNNISETCLWVNLSANIRGRIALIDVSDDVSLINHVETHFPVGSAIRVYVQNVQVDPATGRRNFDLSARSKALSEQLSLKSISSGMILPARVTKITDRSVLAQLTPQVVGQISLADIDDDYDKADPTKFAKNSIIKVCVVDVDPANKRLSLTTRPSKVLSSSLPVRDKFFTRVSQLSVGEVVRGFIKNIADIGIFVYLGHTITAFIPVSELSDSFLKDWKSHFEVDRMVTGKVTMIDEATKNVKMSLKRSIVSNDYIPPLSFHDLKQGQVVTGKIRKVEDFGAFIVVDNSNNVSGLCHRSQMAEPPPADARKIYNEGDAVKAIVLKLEAEKRRVSFGLKAKSFENASDDESEMDAEMDDSGVDLNDLLEDDSGSEGGLAFDLEQGDKADTSDTDSENTTQAALRRTAQEDNDEGGLDAGGFDWTGSQPQPDTAMTTSTSTPIPNPELNPKPNKKQPRTFQPDLTATLDTMPPSSTSDFERLLLGDRDNPILWMQYMSHHLQLSDVAAARRTADRALAEIGITRQAEKLDVWTAYLNLELSFGTDESLDVVFDRACAHADRFELHDRLVNIFVQAGRPDRAHDVLRSMAGTKAFTASPALWKTYAHFLFDVAEPPRPADARALYSRAKQSVPLHLQRQLYVTFATLEFKCRNGDPERGRTAFEGLFDTYPGHWDHWDVLLALEKSRGDEGQVRRLYERMTGQGGRRMKGKRARRVFGEWRAFEERRENGKGVERVRAKEREWEEKKRGE